MRCIYGPDHRSKISTRPLSTQLSAMNGAMIVFSDEQMHSLQISDKEDNAWGTHTEIGAPSSLLSRFRTNLANYLGDRYLRLGNKDDVDEAIVLMREVIKNTDTSDDLPGRRNNLAALLGDRYSGEGDREDLAEAVQQATRALGQHPGRHSEEVTRCAMNNLVALLVDNGCTTSNRQRQETDEAIKLLEAAINTSPESSPQTATLLYNLARVHLFRFHRLRDGKSLRQAQDLFFNALTQRWALVHVRILAGREYLSLPCVFDSRDRDLAEAAVETCAKLVPVSISYSLSTQDKQRILSQALGIGSDSATSALHFDKGASYAMTLLETGRAVLSSSLLNLREGDISSLSESTPELVEQFTKSRAFLDENSAMARALRAVEDIENHRYHVGLRSQYARRIYEDKLTRAIELIRKKPMFEGFMSHATETDMLHAAKDGPIVALNVTSHRCGALVIQADKISTLELPNLDIQFIQARSSDPQSVKTLSWLWDTIVLTVLDYLGYHGPPAGTGNSGSMPHIWWFPTGSLIGFPLHAAGHHLRRNSETALERVVASYSLSVNVLIRTRQQRRYHLAGTLRSQKAVIVSAPRPPGQQALHHAEDEAKAVCQVYHSRDFPRYHDVHDIVKRLKSCCILHFIGHGKTDKQDPFGSALILDSGDELAINELVETALNSNPPFLAYLSACGTGRVGNETATDELHLAAAFQVAGFRHIIATLWDVDDQLYVDMAKKVYTSLETTELDDVSVRTALRGAVVALRDEWVQQEEEAGRGGTRGDRNLELCQGSSREKALWVPYVHFGA